MGGGSSKKSSPEKRYQVDSSSGDNVYCTKNLKPNEAWDVSIFKSSTTEDGMTRSTTVTDDVTKEWKLQDKLGVGSTSTVFKCVSVSNPDIACACKVINKKRLGVSKKRQSQMIAIAKNEVALMKKLSHDCIVRLMGFYENDKDLYVITELMNGGELLDIVMDSGNLNNFQALTVARRIGAGIMHLHQIGIMHRDIKPENILLKVKGDLNTVKLIDFGLSKSATNTKSFIGTQGYLAPEMSPTRKEYTPAVDMWALGITLYAIMTGCLPFDDDQEALNQDGAKIIASFPSDMWENRDKRCIDAVKGLLDLDPKKRLTAEQFCNHEWLKRGHDICTPQIQEQLNEKPNADALPAEQPTQPVEVTNDTGTSPANIKEETSNDTDVADKLASIPSKPAANSSESATIEVSNVPTPNQVVEEHQSIPKQA